MSNNRTPGREARRGRARSACGLFPVAHADDDVDAVDCRAGGGFRHLRQTNVFARDVLKLTAVQVIEVMVIVGVGVSDGMGVRVGSLVITTEIGVGLYASGSQAATSTNTMMRNKIRCVIRKKLSAYCPKIQQVL